ncbi:sigma-70 family RNA polymerase sigma factor [Peribacillus muralis]|uniref:sigma-70 family RNA polymerase sigma factor n=1 Tax=Peribacillus muralis TaxID=264697 RepID=UPI003CFF0EB3
MSMVLDKPITKNIDGEQLTVEEVITKFKRFVHFLAIKHQLRAKALGAAYDDLVSEGNIGLLRAYKNYDYSLGYKFSTYAHPAVNGSMLRMLRDMNPGAKYPRRVKDYGNQVELEDNRESIARKLNIPLEEADEVFAYKRYCLPVSLYVPDIEEGTDQLAYQVPVYEDFTNVHVKEFINLIKSQENDLEKVLIGLLQGKHQRQIGMEIGLNQVGVSRRLQKIRRLYNLTPEEVL